MIDEGKYKEVHDLIRERPIVSREIEQLVGIDGSAVRSIVRQLRRDGFIIVGSNKGYYETDCEEEVVRIVRDLQARIKSLTETLALLEENAHKRFGYRIKTAIESHIQSSRGVQDDATEFSVGRTRYGTKESSGGRGGRTGVPVVQVHNQEEGSGQCQDQRRCEDFSFDDLLRSAEEDERGVV